MRAKITERYTHISTSAARSAVELLEKIHPQAQFVDDFVDVSLGADAKLLQ